MWRVSYDGDRFRAVRVATDEFFTTDDWRSFADELRVRLTNDVQAEIVRQETSGHASHTGATKRVGGHIERRGRKRE